MGEINSKLAAREQAAAISSEYSTKKTKTDTAAENLITSVGNNSASSVVEDAKAKLKISLADEQLTLLSEVAKGGIPIPKLDKEKLKDAPGFTGSDPNPAYLNDAKWTVLGWLGNDSDGSTNGKIVATILTDSPARPNPTEIVKKIRDDGQLRAEQAGDSAVSLSVLKKKAEENITQIQKDIAASRSSGGSPQAAAQMAAKVEKQKNILDKITSAMAAGEVSTTSKPDVVVVSPEIVEAKKSSGIFSPTPPEPIKPPVSGSSGVTPPSTSKTGPPQLPEKPNTKQGSKDSIDGTCVWWDAGGPKQGIQSGVYDDKIFNHVYPKLKHAFHANFTGKLSVLNWLVKTIDRPKGELESIEQMRFNAKRIYPVKYGLTSVSITFWDDVNHVTIKAIESYFHGSVWAHKSIPSTGSFLLRDSVIIPSFTVIDYVIESKTPLTYTFYNAALESFDFDGHDDMDDGGVHTVQMVLKVEGFTIS